MTRPASICYVELPAPDVERSAAFYRDVFGWTVEPSDLTRDPYWTFSTGGLGGALDPRKPVQRQAGVLLYLAVDDLEATLAAIERAGGATVQARRPVGGEFGFFAEFRDPAGNHLGLWCRT